jgi:hypothetical protein
MDTSGTAYQVRFIGVAGVATFVSALIVAWVGILPMNSALHMAFTPLAPICLVVGLLSPFTTVAVFLLSMFAARRMTASQVAIAATSCVLTLLGAGYWLVRFFFMGPPAS